MLKGSSGPIGPSESEPTRPRVPKTAPESQRWRYHPFAEFKLPIQPRAWPALFYNLMRFDF